MTLRETIRNFVRDTRGANEYINTLVLVAVIAIAGIAAFTGIGTAIQGQADTKAGRIQGLP
jgi:Flp pilus assembly pilin Flp